MTQPIQIINARPIEFIFGAEAQRSTKSDNYSQSVPSPKKNFIFPAISRIPLASLFALLPNDSADFELKWNLADIYPTENDWEKALKTAEKNIETFATIKDKATASGKDLYETLEKFSSANKTAAKIYVYAKLSFDLDTRISKSKAMYDRADKLLNDLSAAGSFLNPALLELSAVKLAQFINEEPRLESIYGHFLDDILRMRPHTLTSQKEKVVADLRSMGDAAYKVFEVYNSAVMPHSTITLSDGREVKLTDSAYTNFRALPNRADRTKVFEAFWDDYARDKKLYAETLNQTVQANVRLAKVRKYNSALEAELFGENLSPQVYSSMMDGVHAGLPTLWRYLSLRKRSLGLDKLEYQDMYASIIPGVELKYTISEGKKLVLSALKPLGEGYTTTIKYGFENRWGDFLPKDGKQSGAYMQGAAVDVHPFVLLNFEGNYNSVSTLAHEFGHAMHSWYSNKAQPYIYSQYSTFIAEVASTVNEILLARYAIDQAKDKNVKLALLGEQLENIRQTIFRQAMFAEFEKIIYDKVWNGEPLTDDVLSEAYTSLLKKYYGHEAGITNIDPRYSVEWAYIQHFYYNFYVYTYATSLTAGITLAKKILDGDKAAIKAYLDMLKRGSSEYPLELLKEAGVDMTSAIPYETAVKEMNAIMDEIEALK